ncbi:hypothetical protein AUJ66_07965 [Candidatus Desantisbacteria bacterium CG1_02_38_46]|uniref:Uncharacterized protein n=1 Tax=Candidatus Desantisbacteria bacterium CG1_02_38_46 TaxID=1817893 RepID=A0A1J4SCD5_9BACT|nr:MAG: hypothetical protein AUJ66_07965 [Candidatus Desantisbacteria bacterium CG1_02_38_46]
MSGVFFDEIVGRDKFFQEIGEDFRHTFLRGQFFWVPVSYCLEKLFLWRPSDYDESKTSAREFIMVPAGTDAFNRNMPLHTPQLETNEEFIVVKSKKRPVILISPPLQDIKINEVRGGGKINRRLCIIAPLYSVENKEGKTKFPIEFIEKVRCLEYPQFFFIPACAGGIKNSFCRLDSIQACFWSHLEPCDLRLKDYVLQIFSGQLEYYTTGRYEGNYAYWREEILKERIQSYK